MIKMTQSFSKWLWDNHRDKFVLISLGHVELLTEEMAQQYMNGAVLRRGRSILKAEASILRRIKQIDTAQV